MEQRQPSQQQERRNSTKADERGGDGRTYVEPATGVAWRVTETGPSALPGHRGARCLLFASDTAIRRVWTYPADWRALSDESLAALSWGT